MKSLLALTLISLAPAPLLAQERSSTEPKVQRTVIEDDSVRIEELRVRGLNTSLVIKPKHATPYELLPMPGGRDPSHGRGGSQGAAGQRVWNVFKF
ncbi:MAG: hypothetical protein Q8L49_03310 [Burkholderiaceae bacterium]|nr:hypothetical protein [Burkholderiaceae bacterium]